MKTNILFVLVLTTVFVFYLFFTGYNTDNFHNSISEIMTMSRDRLKEDGMNSSQIQSILSAVDMSARAAYTSSGVIINSLLPFLVSGLLLMGLRLSALEKELKEIKKQLDLNKGDA